MRRICPPPSPREPSSSTRSPPPRDAVTLVPVLVFNVACRRFLNSLSDTASDSSEDTLAEQLVQGFGLLVAAAAPLDRAGVVVSAVFFWFVVPVTGGMII